MKYVKIHKELNRKMVKQLNQLVKRLCAVLIMHN